MMYAPTNETSSPAKRKGVALAVGLTAGIATLFGIAAAALASPSSGKSPATKGGVETSAWKKATTIQPGDRVRFSVAASDFKTLAASIPGVTYDPAGFDRLLQLPQVKSALQASTVQAWSPGEALPIDWPPDDTARASEYHGEFVYGGSSPLTLASIPIPVTAWTIPGTKQAPPPSPAQPGGATAQTTFAAWMDAAHSSAIVYRGVLITTIPAMPSASRGAIAIYIYPQKTAAGQTLGYGQMYVAVHEDFTATDATNQAMAFLASQGADASATLGDPSIAPELVMSEAQLYSATGKAVDTILVIPIRVAGTQLVIEHLALYHITQAGQTYLQALTAPSSDDAAGYAAQSLAAWRAANP